MEDREWEVVWGMPGYLAVRYSWVGDLWGNSEQHDVHTFH